MFANRDNPHAQNPNIPKELEEALDTWTSRLQHRTFSTPSPMGSL